MSTPINQSWRAPVNSRGGLTTCWLILLLLGLIAGCAAPSAPVTQPASVDAVRAQALAWLRTQALPTGGFPDSQGQFSANNTSTVLSVLAGLPAEEISDFRLTDALTALEPTVPDWLAAKDSGPLAKAILGVTAAGGNPHMVDGQDLVADLWAHYDAQTGLFHPESFFRHLLSVQALIASGESVPDAALAAIGHLQQPDGSWSWRISADTPTTGDVDTTAQTLLTLAAAGVGPEDSRVRAALTYLAQTQSAPGGWAMDADAPPNANSTGLVLTALGKLGLADQPHPAIRAAQAQTWLAALQQPDGSFHYAADLPGAVFMATLDALPAFQWDFGMARE